MASAGTTNDDRQFRHVEGRLPIFPQAAVIVGKLRGVFETSRSRCAIESNPPGLKKSVTSGGVVLIRAGHLFD
jgi:hypothetical protein